jgi:hypothetical protein
MCNWNSWKSGNLLRQRGNGVWLNLICEKSRLFAKAALFYPVFAFAHLCRRQQRFWVQQLAGFFWSHNAGKTHGLKISGQIMVRPLGISAIPLLFGTNPGR